MRLPAVLAATLLAGCQAMMYGTSSDFTRVSLGMTKQQVIDAIGAPHTVRADEASHEEHLIYVRMPKVIAWAPRDYDVTLKDGLVVHFGDIVKY